MDEQNSPVGPTSDATRRAAAPAHTLSAVPSPQPAPSIRVLPPEPAPTSASAGAPTSAEAPASPVRPAPSIRVLPPEPTFAAAPLTLAPSAESASTPDSARSFPSVPAPVPPLSETSRTEVLPGYAPAPPPPPPSQQANVAPQPSSGTPIVQRGPRTKARFVTPPVAAAVVVDRKELLTGNRRNEGKPAFSRNRKIAGDLPAWSPTPPGEILIQRKGVSGNRP